MSASSQQKNEALGFVIHDVARMLRRSFDQRAQQVGLTRSQWSVLVHLNRCDGMQQKLLAEQMDITPISLSGLVDRLERDGWVERRPDPVDRRAKRLYLTPKVAPVMNSLQQIGRELRAEAYRDFTEQEQQQFMELLLKLRCSLCDR